MPGAIERDNGDKGLPVDLIKLFLENQKKELELRAQELEITKQEELHNYDVTKLSLKAQTDSLENERKHRRQLWSMWVKYGAFLSVVVASLVALALGLGKEQFILEIFRAVFYGGFGASAGAYYQKSKLLANRQDEMED